MTLLLTSCGGDGGDGAGGAGEETLSFRYASPATSTSSLGEGAEWWAERLNEQSEGRIDVELFQDSSLIAATDTLAGVQEGRAEIGYLASLFYPEQLPLTNVAGLPFVSDDAEAVQRALYELYQSNEAFRAEYEDLGLRVLFFLPVGATVAGFEEPIDSLEDFDGLTVRAAGLAANAFAEVGANPVFLQTAEIFEGLQRGVVDGFGGLAFDLAISLGLHEAAPAFVHPGLGSYASAVVVMRLEDWNELPDDLQAVIDDVSQEYMSQSVEMVMEFDDRLCDRLISEGGSVTILPESETEAWSELGDWDSLWVQAAVDAGVPEETAASFLEEYRSIVQELEGQGAYEDGAVRCAERSE